MAGTDRQQLLGFTRRIAVTTAVDQLIAQARTVARFVMSRVFSRVN